MSIRSKPLNRNYVLLPWVALLLAMFIIWASTGDDFGAPPARIFAKTAVSTTVGNITSIHLHETPTSTSTTLVTDVGSFHVRGAVSAALGDGLTLTKETTGSTERTFACIGSKIKTGCYNLL
ncbi:hypothetical protein ROT11_006685 [Pseudomonas aeruginosa]|nr:hypothetical protein [Pseudomonas aeruginosa]ELL4401389.1 hypothetical protein [Pseudomonas aeruginosa]